MLRRSDIEYTLLGSDSFKYSVFNSFDDGVNNSLIHDYADFPWLGIPQMLEEEGPVIVDITDDGVTVTGDTDGIIRAAYDAAAGAWVFEPIVKDIYEGMIIESFLPEDNHHRQPQPLGSHPPGHRLRGRCDGLKLGEDRLRPRYRPLHMGRHRPAHRPPRRAGRPLLPL